MFARQPTIQIFRYFSRYMRTMISRRENLLIRPWQQKRYDNHRRKVQSAGPVIDNKPPITRQHVLIKSKKQQKEIERCQEIENNNFLLLRKINDISKTNRVDNHWSTPQPNFLNRVAIYDIQDKMLDKCEIDAKTSVEKQHQSRRQKCYACTPQQLPETNVPEERIPWEPEKLPISRKIRSRSVPTLQKPLTIPETCHSAPLLQTTKHKQKSLPKVKFSEQKNRKEIPHKSTQNILLTRGCLKLLVNFPADTIVKFQRGHQERILMHGLCNCKNHGISV